MPHCNILLFYGAALHELIGRAHGRCHIYFVTYDIANCRAHCESSWKRLLNPYNIISFFITSLWPFLTIYTVIGIGILDPNSGFKPLTYFTRIFLDSISFVVVSLTISLCRHRMAAASHLNFLMDYYSEKLMKRTGKNIRKDFGMTWKNILSEYINEIVYLLGGNKDADLMGIFFISLLIIIGLLPPVYFWCELIGQFAIFSFLFNRIFPKHERTLGTDLILRFSSTALNSILALETARILNTLMVGFTWCGVGCYHLLNDVYESKGSILQRLYQYRCLCIAQNRLYALIEELIYSTYEVGTLLMTIFLTGVVIGWGLIPWPMIVICCFALAFMAPGMVVFVNLGIYPNDHSTRMLREWKYEVKHGKLPKKYKALCLKSVIALMPVGFPVKHLGLMDVDFMLKLYTRIVTNTQDLILTLVSFQ